MYFLFIFGILVFSIALIFLIDKNSSFLLRFVSSSSTGLVLVLSCLLMAKFDDNLYHYQYLTTYEFDTNIFNISFSFGLDGLSVIFIFLSSLLIFLTILFIWQDSFFKEYCLSLLIIEIFLYLIFSTLDLFIFYVFFEAILIPMYLVIGIWGSRQRKIRAVYLFFFYTLCGSIFMLVGILYIFSVVGTLNLEYLILHKFDTKEQILLWLAFFVSFSSKIPLFPFHIWLPEAHVEAPTVGSVLLAGILLKLGVYGFLRFSLILFPEGSQYFSPLVYLLSITGVLYASFTAIRQTDLKRVIAYSSVAHMNLVTLGIFSFNSLGLEGAILQSVSHGFVSGGLFFLIGILYNRHHSRFLFYYGGLVQLMPIYSSFFLIFTLANIALPGTSSFVGEFLLLCSMFKLNGILCFFSSLGVILCGAYSLWLYNRIIFGNIKIEYTMNFNDMKIREVSIIFPLFIFLIIMGIFPSIFSSFIHLTCYNILYFSVL